MKLVLPTFGTYKFKVVLYFDVTARRVTVYMAEEESVGTQSHKLLSIQVSICKPLSL